MPWSLNPNQGAARQLDREIATSLDADPELLPLIPELLRGIFAIGSDPYRLVEVLGTLDTGIGGHWVDAGCGKGAVALALARAFDCRVLGVDAFAPFVDEANLRAQQEGLDARARFECSDLRTLPERGEVFDGALWIGLGPVLGDLERIVAWARPLVRPGGLIVIEDACRAAGVPPDGGGPGNLEESRASLTSHGDRLLAEDMFSPAESERVEQALMRQLEANARRLMREQPDQSPRLERFLAVQERESERLATDLVPTLWILERG